VSLAKYQEVIFLLKKLSTETSIAAEANKSLQEFRKSNDTILAAYRNKESAAREVVERQRQQEADKQRQHGLLMLERQAKLEIQKSMIESVERRSEAILKTPFRRLVD
jgi:CheY-like chemotaxis protein